jgi:hypothetical protein
MQEQEQAASPMISITYGVAACPVSNLADYPNSNGRICSNAAPLGRVSAWQG